MSTAHPPAAAQWQCSWQIGCRPTFLAAWLAGSRIKNSRATKLGFSTTRGLLSRLSEAECVTAVVNTVTCPETASTATGAAAAHPPGGGGSSQGVGAQRGA